MKRKSVLFYAFILVVALLCLNMAEASIVYYDLDFEDGTTGGGYPFPGFGEASIIDSSNLDGKALYFEVDDQMVWDRNAADSDTHHVAFDYFIQDESGANVTQFLDIPSILRLDVSQPGRHHIDVYYSLSAKKAWSFIDDTLDMSLLTILAWEDTPSTETIRILNQSDAPGLSEGPFEIDNLLWEGDVALPTPEPGTLLLFGSGLVGFGLLRRKEK